MLYGSREARGDEDDCATFETKEDLLFIKKGPPPFDSDTRGSVSFMPYPYPINTIVSLWWGIFLCHARWR